ncbi:MAG: AbrB family transcriptional regulator [Alphaproteobacteria bacterium]|nr:AbrB family transcriptional regulator [Alphaproteobacteria bacterium]
MTAPLRPPRGFAAVALAVALGTAGGALFQLLQLPLPWMLGSLTVVTLAAMLGMRMHLPSVVRDGAVPIIGLMLGAAFTPEVIARMAEWWLTMSAMVVWAVAGTALAYSYFRLFTGYDRVTAFFSATPGGLNDMMLLGRYYGADDRTISLTHAARLITVVFTIPFWYRFDGTLPPTSRPPGAALTDLGLGDAGVLAVCALVGAWLGTALRLPAGLLVGPMILSTAAHLAGLTGTAPPAILVAGAQVAIGVAVGCRFGGVTFGHVGRALFHAMVIALIMISLTVVTALLVRQWTDLPMPALILGFAPGGLAEMSLIALALHVDAPFVACHHIARIVFVIFSAPLVVKAAGAKPAGDRRDD